MDTPSFLDSRATGVETIYPESKALGSVKIEASSKSTSTVIKEKL
jgi:hypothetical protein